MIIRLPDAPAYLVAFSGGADSRLLLGLTAEVARATGARVCAAHLHHGIRGEEADRDEAFCRRVCAELGVPLFVEHADIPARAAASGRSIEFEAREARYDFFARLMAQENIPVLLTAHHADDNLETVLLRLLRGSGTRGMGGIPYERPLPCRTGNTPYNGTSRRVVRPLLDCTRAEIEAELASRGWDYVTDSTNASPDHTRNRLRHTVVPTLESIAGEGIPQRCATRLARAAAEDDEALTAIAEAQFAASGDPQTGAIPLSALVSLPPAIAKRMLLCGYAAYLRSRGEESVPLHRTLSAYHLDALLTLAREGQAGDVSDELPAEVRAAIAGDRLTFAAAESDETAKAAPARDPVPLALGITPWDVPFSVLTEASDTPLAPLTGDGVWTSATFPTSVGELHIRARTTGDTILSHGMHKKIKKLLCDKHIPAALRDRLPLVCLHDGQILWCPAVAFSDGFPPPAKGGCIRISLLKNPEQH